MRAISIKTRRLHPYLDIALLLDGEELDLGLFDDAERRDFAAALRSMADDCLPEDHDII